MNEFDLIIFDFLLPLDVQGEIYEAQETFAGPKISLSEQLLQRRRSGIRLTEHKTELEDAMRKL